MEKPFFEMKLVELIKSQPDFEKDEKNWNKWYEVMQIEIGSFLTHGDSVTYKEKMDEIDERLEAIEKMIKELGSHHHSDGKVLFEAEKIRS